MSGVRIRSSAEWKRLRDAGARVFSLSQRLPSVVSSLSPIDEPFFDGDVVVGESGWGLVSSLAVAHDDPTVSLMVVDPGSSYFTDATGEYGGFSCRSNSSSDCYADGLFGLDGAGVAGQIGYAADVIAIFGESGRWGLWVERNVAGLVVSSFPSALGAWGLEHGPFLSVEDALDGFVGLNLGEGASGSAFGKILKRNYAAFGAGNY